MLNPWFKVVSAELVSMTACADREVRRRGLAGLRRRWCAGSADVSVARHIMRSAAVPARPLGPRGRAERRCAGASADWRVHGDACEVETLTLNLDILHQTLHMSQNKETLAVRSGRAKTCWRPCWSESARGKVTFLDCSPKVLQQDCVDVII